MTLMGKATEKGLEEVSKAVLAPHFHAVGVSTKKVREAFLYILVCVFSNRVGQCGWVWVSAYRAPCDCQPTAWVNDIRACPRPW